MITITRKVQQVSGNMATAALHTYERGKSLFLQDFQSENAELLEFENDEQVLNYFKGKGIDLILYNDELICARNYGGNKYGVLYASLDRGE